MKKTVDACGLSCPEPVVLLKQVIDSMAGAGEIELVTDNPVCVENCTRFAQSRGFGVKVKENGAKFTLAIAKG